jgi:hypothetical protein
MPFEIGEVLNQGAGWIGQSPLVFGVIRNPVLTALLLTALALVIIHAMYGWDLKKTGWRRSFKVGFWLLLSASALLFVHYYALERHLLNSLAPEGVRNIVRSIHHSVASGGGYPVYPSADDFMDLNPTAGPDVADSPGASDSPRAAGPGDTDPLDLPKIFLTSPILRPAAAATV